MSRSDVQQGERIMDVSEQFLAALKQEFPNFRVIEKRTDLLSHSIDVILKIITLGKQRSYLDAYYTVLGYTLYVPPAWARTSPIERVITLRHERVHLRQRRRLGFPVMAFLYLVPFFPLGLAYGRARLEWEAYEETLAATAELAGLEAARSPALRARIVGRFIGPDYGWMWPFPKQVGRWYDAAMVRLERTFGDTPAAPTRGDAA